MSKSSLIILLLLTQSAFGQVVVDTFITTDEVDDAPIYYDLPTNAQSLTHRNGGVLKSVALYEEVDATPIKHRLLTRPNTTALRAAIPASDKITSARFYFKGTALFPEAQTIKAFPVYGSMEWQEGGGNMTDTSYRSCGGVSWANLTTPTAKPTIPNVVYSSWDWRDSSIISAPKAQGTCNSCWAFSVVAVLESMYKKYIYTGLYVDNGGDGVNADRSEVSLITAAGRDTSYKATGWVARTIPYWLADLWYRAPTSCNGIIFQSDAMSSGYDCKVNTSEAASNAAFYVINYISIDEGTGLESERSLKISGADVMDTWINSDAATTNYGSADSARINSTGKYWSRPDSLRRLIIADLTSTGDTFGYTISMVESVYVTKYGNADNFRSRRCLKYARSELQMTWNQWQTDYEWATAGANYGDEADLSEQQALSCIEGYDCDNGGSLSSAFDIYSQDSIFSESQFGYVAWEGQPCLDQDENAAFTRIPWAYYMHEVKTDSAYKALITELPTTLLMNVDATFPAYDYSLSDLCWDWDGVTSSPHAVQVVGWDNNRACDGGEGTGAWLVKNQYGSGWGQDGFGWITYDSDLYTPGSSYNVFVFDTDNAPVPWSEPGLGAGTDRSTYPCDTLVYETNDWLYLEVPTFIVQGWLDGTIVNNGIMVTSSYTGGGSSLSIYLSEEVISAANRSFWEITHERTIEIGPGNYGNVKIGN